MDFWRQKGRPAIFEALTRVCDEIDSSLLTELKTTDGHSENSSSLQLSGRLKSAKSLIDDLRDENESLRTQLAAVQAVSKPMDKDSITQKEQGTSKNPIVEQAVTSSATLVTPRSSDPSLAEKQQANLKLEYANLSARFNALSENFKKAKSALEKRKEERDRWVQHANHLESRIKAAETEHKIRILDRGHAVTGSATHPTTPATAAPSDPKISFDSEIESTDALPRLPRSPVNVVGPALEADATLPGSTQDEPEDELPPLLASDSPPQVRVKTEPSSDAPIVVSERAVRKRKREDTSADPVVHRRIKTEESDGSSPTMQGKGFNFSPQESIDLGEVSAIMATPRKRKEPEYPALPGMAPISTVSFTTPTPLMVRPDGAPQTTRPSLFSSALTPISVNKRVIRSGGDKPAVKPIRKNLGRYIGVLAENGAVYEADPSALHSTGVQLNPAIKGKLNAMLNTVAGENEDEMSDALSTPRQRRLPASLRKEITVPAPRELPFVKRAGPVAVDSPHQTRLSGRESAAGWTRSRKEVSLLRNKPLSELRLEDFKVNPLVNDGQNFAYSEVVRNKADRACLPGCTDMLCCGKEFRALAISQRPNPPLTPAQKEEEKTLLEDYLGDYAYRLRNMSEEERAELWVEAKTQELANKYGKHRHRFSRMQSPPGFWNADFPSTQELEVEKSEASKREQASVKERYREAMRPGGRWLFKDE